MKTILPILYFLLLTLAPYTSWSQDKTELASTIKAYLETLKEGDKFSGTIIVAKDGQPILREAYGWANLSHQVPNKINTKFSIASIGKMITAVAIMQLKERGQLQVDDYVGKFLPDYPKQSIRDSVSIAHLLTHTSGMGQFFNDSFFKTSKDQLRSISDFLPLFVDDQLAFSPGARYSYSNAGYLLLGLIIEAISGQTYDEYIRQHIYEPLGMKDTDAFDLDAVVPNMAIGYVRPEKRDGEWTTNLYKTMRGGPAGGEFSTVDDLLQFANAIRSYQLLNKETTELMTSGKVEGYNGRYGYGFDDRLENEHRIVGHIGGYFGIKGEVQMYWDLGYTVIILTNKTNVGYEDVSYFIQNLLVGTPEEQQVCTLTSGMIETIKEKGYEATVSVLGKLKFNTLSATLIEIKGYEQMIENRLQAGIDIFRLGTFFAPDSFNAHYNLGAAYRDASQTKLAIKSFEKCLELNPQAAFVKQQLEQLKLKKE